jgi:hypothetical protein
VASVPDRDDLVVEIWSGSEQVAELRREDAGPQIQMYSRKTGWWEFPYADFLAVLKRAREELEKLSSAPKTRSRPAAGIGPARMGAKGPTRR